MQISNKAMRLSLVLFVVGLIYVSCRDADEITDPLMIISGTVTDSVTGVAIDSALIVVDDTSHSVVTTYTDTLGEYDLELLGLAGHVVYCRKSGYQTKWVSVPKPVGDPVVRDVNFQLTP